jgi:uncharacterized membrane protein
MTRTVVALFDDYDTANSAVQELINNGFNREDISYMANDPSGDYARRLGIPQTGAAAQDVRKETTETSGAGVGAGIGAAVGGIGGILIGLGALMIPGIGPVVAAGPLAAVLSGLVGAGAGAVAGGILGALVDMGIPEETASYYAEGIRRGGTLITVRTDDYMSDRAVEVLNRHNPVNLKERVGEWRQTGWTGFRQERMGSDYQTSPSAEEQRRMEEEHQIPDTGMGPQGMGPQGTMGMGQDVHGTGSGQGTYGMGRDVYGSGSIHDADIRENRQSSGPMAPREIDAGGDTFGGEGTVGSEYGNVGSRGGGLPETEVPPSERPMGAGRDYGDYSIYDARFRNDFQRSPYSRDYSYAEYEPAYHYGYDMAHNDVYRGKRWEDIEPNIRRDWERDHPNTWDRFRDSIRNAWEDVKDALD